jgi:hypothetical protein
LRFLRGQYRKDSGKLLSFKDIARAYREELLEDWTVSQRLKAASVELREAIAAELLKAYGLPFASAGLPAAFAEELPHTLFMRRAITFTDRNTLGTNDSLPYDNPLWRALPRYNEIQFKTAEVLRIWPPSQEATDQSAQPLPMPDPEPAKRRRTSNGFDYRTADAPLVAEGLKGVRNGTYKNPTDAGRALAKSAPGFGSEASKATRLTRQISERLIPDGDH